MAESAHFEAPRSSEPVPLFFPSDLKKLGADIPPQLCVAGRVLSTGGEQLVLADAIHAIYLPEPEDAPLNPGDLIELEWDRTVEPSVTRLRQRYPCALPRGDGEFARLALSGVGSRLAQRARALSVVRQYFDAEGFVEVDTPIRVRSPGLDLYVDALAAGNDWLITSPEYHMKRLLVGGMPRIYQLTHCFRADSPGPLHQPEFMMLEWYRAFATQQSVMNDTEAVVTRVTHELCGGSSLSLDGRSFDLAPPFERVSVADAFREFAGESDALGLSEQDEDRFFELLVNRVEPGLARHNRPVFLWQYPKSQASLARLSPTNPEVAERFELFLGGIELCNGFGELTDAKLQRSRLVADQRAREKRGLPKYPIDEKFLGALEEGLPPSGGNALGIDRLIALATGRCTIAEVMAFPEDRR